MTKTSLILLIALAAPLPLAAQQPAPAPGAVDAAKLPVDTSRIERALKQAPPTTISSAGAFWNYYVEVRARGLEFNLFGDTPDAATGPARYGAPSHNEMFILIGPPQFRASTSMAFRRPTLAKKISR